VTAAKPTSWSDSPLVLLGGALVVVLIAGAGITAYANARGMGVDRAHLIDDTRAIVVVRPSTLFGAPRARTLEVDVATGVVRSVTDDVGRFGYDLHVYGPAGGNLWFASGPTDVWGRSITDRTQRIDPDWAHHVELAGGIEARWRTPSGLIVKGRAGNEYLVDGAGHISPSDWTRNAMLWMNSPADAEPYPRTRASLQLPEHREIRAEVVPVESGGLVTRNDGSVVLAAGGAAILVGGDLAVPVGRPRIDRVAAVSVDGPVWTASAEEWFGEPIHWDLWMEWLSIRVLAAESRGDVVSFVLHASDNDGSDELRFVVVDARTGAVRSASPLGPLP
jgi:hypothetical protein